VAESRLAESLLPAQPAVAARWSVAVMELGALVCTSARPQCARCPLAAGCAWLLSGRPQDTAKRPTQRYEGTDRQARGALLALLRDADAPLTGGQLATACPGDPVRRARALDGLVADGLAEPHADGTFTLPRS
jgi:A/G-specific adenine glycosylase